jgi:hypothetical protein
MKQGKKMGKTNSRLEKSGWIWIRVKHVSSQSLDQSETSSYVLAGGWMIANSRRISISYQPSSVDIINVFAPSWFFLRYIQLRIIISYIYEVIQTSMGRSHAAPEQTHMAQGKDIRIQGLYLHHTLGAQG